MKALSDKPKNLTELARALGVSRTLVSQVANNHSSAAIKPETRQRILDAIREFDVSLNRKASKQVCVVEIDRPLTEEDRRAQHPYFGERINLGIRRVASESDYALSFVPMKGDWQAKVRGMAQTHSIAGILMIGQADVDVIDAANKSEVPTVLVDCNDVRSQADSVEMDQSEMVRLAVETLVRSGAKNIAFLHPQSGHPNDEFRLMAFHYHLTSCGLAFQKDLVIPCHGHIHSGQTVMTDLLKSKKKFDAVIGSGDYALAGALFSLQAAGKRVPEDVQLLSIGGDPICYTVEPTLSNVDGGAVLLGERAMSQLLQRIEAPNQPPERVMVRPVFHDGRSLLKGDNRISEGLRLEGRSSALSALD